MTELTKSRTTDVSRTDNISPFSLSSELRCWPESLERILVSVAFIAELFPFSKSYVYALITNTLHNISTSRSPNNIFPSVLLSKKTSSTIFYFLLFRFEQSVNNQAGID